MIPRTINLTDENTPKRRVAGVDTLTRIIGMMRMRTLVQNGTKIIQMTWKLDQPFVTYYKDLLIALPKEWMV